MPTRPGLRAGPAVGRVSRAPKLLSELGGGGAGLGMSEEVKRGRRGRGSRAQSESTEVRRREGFRRTRAAGGRRRGGAPRMRAAAAGSAADSLARAVYVLRGRRPEEGVEHSRPALSWERRHEMRHLLQSSARGSSRTT